MLGTSTKGAANGDDLTIAGSGHRGITIRSTNSSDCNIYFSDGTSGADEYRGYLAYVHSDNSFRIGANGSEKLRILSGGGLTFNADTAADNALDDYEEGTYTPADASGNGITYTSDRTARYVKIGRLVYVQFDFTLTNCNNLTTQSAIFTLPFSLGHSYGSGVIGWTTLNKPCQLHIGSSGAYLMDNDSDTSIYLKNSQLNNIRFIGSMHYVTTT